MGLFEVKVHLHRHWLCFFLLYRSALLALTSAATVPQPIQLNISSAGATTSAIHQSLRTGNADFHIYPTFNGPPLDQNSVLMSAVQLMAKEALEDITGDVPRTFWNSQDPRYSSVGIFVLPSEQVPTVNRRTVMWGLDQSLYYMMGHNRFTSVKFRMTIGEYDVGAISYDLLSNEQQRLSANKTISRLEQRGHTSKSDTVEAIKAPTLHAASLRVFCRLCGYDLEASDIFRPVVAMLRGMAEFPSRHHIGNYRTLMKSGQTTLMFKDEKRSAPPFFEVQYLVQATAAIPQYMLNKGTFSETEIRIDVDGTLVAIGLLNIQRDPPPRYARKKKTACVIS